ncbi:GNAT family N-acetyltransferase [Sulfoacidibacillus ferrooxidans]|uniref:Ribosomal N-acetyltransferase YdaF n=1 Tax=Sulfoacidibacillus ferrooxidans TaxID=2005001 RepID=A0A9X2AGD5_9BACL|nr:GNAT family N-acetyltransferase [Sulfoacidibacillus ferrooxidans]MCI0184946.1 putative ribosomal N-acetyltransferase YdaF [Sulfoacidibacillus ferrooxidans]
MRLNSERVYIRRMENEDLEALLDLRLRNRHFFKPFQPITLDSHYTVEGQQEILEKIYHDWNSGSGYGFGIFLTNDDRLIGRVNLSNVARGAWESCTLGYFIDENCNGQGFASEAVHLAIGFAFGPAELHRVQAAVMPRNAGSTRVLEKVGFRYEGFSEFYLKINGVWEDHNLYSITRERWNS